MSGDEQEPRRAGGLPRDLGRRPARKEAQQYAMGLPADWFTNVNGDWLRSLAHPVRGYRRWAQRRRLGIYAPDEDDE